MAKGKDIFQGNVQIYLQGKSALIYADEVHETCVTFFIGSSLSKLRMNDYRKATISATQRALSGIDEEKFSDVFNQPANARVFVSDREGEIETIEIDLYPVTDDGKFPILWMGVIDDLLMPMHDIAWECLRPIDVNRVAFLVMVNAVASQIDEKETISLQTKVYSWD